MPKTQDVIQRRMKIGQDEVAGHWKPGMRLRDIKEILQYHADSSGAPDFYDCVFADEDQITDLALRAAEAASIDASKTEPATASSSGVGVNQFLQIICLHANTYAHQTRRVAFVHPEYGEHFEMTVQYTEDMGSYISPGTVDRCRLAGCKEDSKGSAPIRLGCYSLDNDRNMRMTYEVLFHVIGSGQLSTDTVIGKDVPM